MFDTDALGAIAQVGLGLAGFSGIALVLTRGGTDLTRIERDRLGIMLGSSLGATFLALLPLVFAALAQDTERACRSASATMAAFAAGFLWFYVTATLRMRAEAPEIVSPLPFGSVIAGHATNLVLQLVAATTGAACAGLYVLGLVWLLFHAAYQFGRILFIRPRATDAADAADATAATDPTARLQQLSPD